MDKAFLLILGMHRSGTSCLTGALEQCGLYLGKVHRKGKYNKKGNLEKKEIQKIHDQLLRLNKGTWLNPPEHIQVHPVLLEQLKNSIQALVQNRPCGLKDPRTLLFLNTWQTIVEPPLRYVGTFRHPMAVARSLQTRNNIPIEQGLELWCTYNRKLVTLHQEAAFPIVHFDLSNKQAYIAQVETIVRQFHLKKRTWQLKRFVSTKLEHQRNANEVVPAHCAELYHYLKEVSQM